MALQMTNFRVDPETMQELETRYPELTRSEIVRLCVEYVRETKPVVEVGRTKLVSVMKGDSE